MISEKSSVQFILCLLQTWTKFSCGANKCQPGSTQYDKYKAMVRELCDLNESDDDDVKDIMCSSKQPTGECDYSFCLNQKAGVQDLVDSMLVVNDCTEQSAKDITEYINYSKDLAHQDNVMMEVNHHRSC